VVGTRIVDPVTTFLASTRSAPTPSVSFLLRRCACSSGRLHDCAAVALRDCSGYSCWASVFFRSPGLAHRSRDYLRASSRFVRACCCCSTISVSFERDEDHHIPAGEKAWIVWCEEVWNEMFNDCIIDRSDYLHLSNRSMRYLLVASLRLGHHLYVTQCIDVSCLKYLA
jgi:hypothetical protein